MILSTLKRQVLRGLLLIAAVFALAVPASAADAYFKHWDGGITNSESGDVASSTTNIYTWTIKPTTDGTLWFCFSETGRGQNIHPQNNGDEVIAGTAKNGVYQQTFQKNVNFKFKTTANRTYEVKLDVTNSSTPYVTITDVTKADIKLIGLNAKWGINDKVSVTNGTYSFDVTAVGTANGKTGVYFRVYVDNTEYKPNSDNSDKEIAFDTPITGVKTYSGNSGAWYAPAAVGDKLTFTFSDDGSSFTVSKQGGGGDDHSGKVELIGINKDWVNYVDIPASGDGFSKKITITTWDKGNTYFRIRVNGVSYKPQAGTGNTPITKNNPFTLSNTWTSGDGAWVWPQSLGNTLVFTFSADGMSFTVSDEVIVPYAEARYYITAEILNHNKVSPEWRLTKGTDGKFYLRNFPLRKTTDTRTSNNDTRWTDPIKLRKYTAPGVYTEIATISDSYFDGYEEVKNYSTEGDGAQQPGWGADAIYDPASDSFSIIPAHGKSTFKETRYPYLGILGQNFQQPNNMKTLDADKTVNGNKLGHTDFGWQEAYVQYDAAGNPIIEDGKALYNTMWPPRNNIFMISKVGTESLNVSTSGMTFAADSLENNAGLVVKTGAEWEAEMKSRDAKEYANLNLDDDTQYYRYSCPNMWMLGTFKIWTGWGGNHECDWGAQWNNHEYFGSWDKTVQDLNPYVTYGTTNDKNYANLNIATRSYFSTVEVYLPVSRTNNYTGNKVGIYLTKGIVPAQIDAQLRNNKEGWYIPSVESIPEGYHISGYRVVRADATVNMGGTDDSRWQPVNPQGEPVSVDLATVKKGSDLDITTADDFKAEFGTLTDGMAFDADLSEGKYFYYLVLNVDNALNDDPKRIVVTSPPLYVYETAVTTEAYGRQLIKVADNKYVTYSPVDGANNYTVTTDADGNIASVDLTDAATVQNACENGTWTARMLVATEIPAQFKRSTATTKTINKFVIREADGGAQLADVKDAAIALIENERPGQRLYHIQDYSATLPTSIKLEADFTASLVTETGTQDMNTEQYHQYTLDVTLPAPRLGEAAYSVTTSYTSEAITTNPDNEGSHQVGDLTDFEHILNVEVPLVKPNVEDAIAAKTFDALATKLTFDSQELNLGFNQAYNNSGVTYTYLDPNATAHSVRLDASYAGGYKMYGNDYAEQNLGAPTRALNAPSLNATVWVGADENAGKYKPFVRLVNIEIDNSLQANINKFHGFQLIDEIDPDDASASHAYLHALKSGGKGDASKAKHLGETGGYFNGLALQTADYETGMRIYEFPEEEPQDLYEFFSNLHKKAADFGFYVAKAYIFNVQDGSYDLNGVSAATPASAPARAAANGNSHVTVMTPYTEVNITKVLTGIDDVEMGQADAFVRTDAGVLEVLADGVKVYGVSGNLVASRMGSYNLVPGVYIARRGDRTVKVTVR